MMSGRARWRHRPDRRHAGVVARLGLDRLLQAPHVVPRHVWVVDQSGTAGGQRVLRPGIVLAQEQRNGAWWADVRWADPGGEHREWLPAGRLRAVR